jgi:hypothetical protein
MGFEVVMVPTMVDSMAAKVVVIVDEGSMEERVGKPDACMPRVLSSGLDPSSPEQVAFVRHSCGLVVENPGRPTATADSQMTKATLLKVEHLDKAEIAVP